MWLRYRLLRSLVGGFLFVAIFFSRYSVTDPYLYEDRDDAVITLSHAKNFVDYGFIGVNPSGPRVEGFSSPVQFWVYTCAYYVTGVSFENFFWWQTFACTFLLGVLFMAFFTGSSRRAFTYTFFAALSLASLWRFIGWHSSGMENPYTHLLFLAVIYTLYTSFERGKFFYGTALILFFASISRVESIYHISPVLCVFSTFWYFKFRSDGLYKKFQGTVLFFLVLLLWGIFNVWRYKYFGDFLPNTSYAQKISVLGRLRDLFSFDLKVIIVSFYLSIKIFLQLGGGILCALVLLYKDGCLRFFKGFQSDKTFLMCICLLLILTGVLAPFLFGSARMDAARTQTHIALCILLMLGFVFQNHRFHAKRSHTFATLMGLIFFGWMLSIFATHTRPLVLLSFGLILLIFVFKVSQNRQWSKLKYLTISIFCALSIFGFRSSIVLNGKESLTEQTYFTSKLGWHHSFDQVDVSENMARIAHNIHRPTVMLGHLGISTYLKKVNVIDGNRLGDPLIRALNDSLLYAFYLDRFPPDLKTERSSEYSTGEPIFLLKKTCDLYTDILVSPYVWQQVFWGNIKTYKQRVYVRKDIMVGSKSKERKFLDDLQRKFSVDRITQEVASCKKLESNSDCRYVFWTVYKFIPELRNAKSFDKVYGLFTDEIERAILRSWRDPKAVSFLVAKIKSGDWKK